MTRTTFSSDDRRRVQEAVRDAEKRVSGEIVPYVVDRSDTYEEVLWRAAAAGGLIGATLSWAIHEATQGWVPFGAAVGIFIVAAFALAGLGAAGFSSAALRLFAGHAILDRRVAQRAAEAFTSEEVFATRDRTGILLFVSLAEHRVLVMADSGIHGKVADGTWEGVVATVVAGVRARRVTDGLVDAIRQCASILETHGFAVQPGDRDELPDNLRTSRR